ncbi:hypothetical protein ELQ90_12890 [Labedella phragmitis]|uniref:Uncharacterized protein n=1 Tax=Labedella phragmitis TaxID=2498849 RepID=A0A3S3Z6B6_9MICO|nr:DUF6264 family protein [Labedella phragmitis]RWZ49646.1 hypothetical protein ELQ90_12890 [Labedella phragmitis]
MNDQPVEGERRPRPQFGELATPEEQRAAIAVPDAVTSSEPVPVEADRPASRLAPSRSVPSAPKAPRPAGDAARAPVDRFISWGLLGLGLFSILQSTVALFDLPAAINAFFAPEDLDAYGPVGAGRVLGLVALVVYIALWVLALVLVQRRVGRGRSSWWIPLVAGVVANVVVLVCVGSAMMIDPAIAAYIQEMAGTPPTP